MRLFFVILALSVIVHCSNDSSEEKNERLMESDEVVESMQKLHAKTIFEKSSRRKQNDKKDKEEDEKSSQEKKDESEEEKLGSNENSGEDGKEEENKKAKGCKGKEYESSVVEKVKVDGGEDDEERNKEKGDSVRKDHGFETNKGNIGGKIKTNDNEKTKNGKQGESTDLGKKKEASNDGEIVDVVDEKGVVEDAKKENKFRAKDPIIKESEAKEKDEEKEGTIERQSVEGKKGENILSEGKTSKDGEGEANSVVDDAGKEDESQGKTKENSSENNVTKEKEVMGVRKGGIMGNDIMKEIESTDIVEENAELSEESVRKVSSDEPVMHVKDEEQATEDYQKEALENVEEEGKSSIESVGSEITAERTEMTEPKSKGSEEASKSANNTVRYARGVAIVQ